MPTHSFLSRPALAALLATVCVPALAQVTSLELTVDTKSNLFFAGRAVTPHTNSCQYSGSGAGYRSDGKLPPHLALSPGIHAMQLRATSTEGVAYSGAAPAPGGPYSSPDGTTTGYPGNVTDPTGAFNGLTFAGRLGILGAAFLDGGEPVATGTAKPMQTFTAATMNAASPAYALGDAFFMGDGTLSDRKGAGVVGGVSETNAEQRQSFLVPAGATRMFFGFTDSYAVSGPYRCFMDNSGEVYVKLMLTTSNDAGQVQAGVGGTAIANVRGNDYVDGGMANATVAATGTWPPGIALDPATGAVTVAPGVVAATYDMDYELCDTRTTPASCSPAKVQVVVTPTAAKPIAPSDNAVAVSKTGTTAAVDLLANDSFDGSAATPANTDVSPQGVWPPGITLDPATGVATVDPAVAAVGNYDLSYRLCEKGSTTNCKNAKLTVSVVNGAVNPITATPDAAIVPPGASGEVIASLRGNDTLGGGSATTGNTGITPLGWPAAFMLTPGGGVSVAPGTPPGTYVLPYRLCETAAPGNCVETSATVTLSAPAGVAAIPTLGEWGLLLTSAALAAMAPLGLRRRQG
ncbi:IPTL-CTERM sorting domain-containing protein [Acidovorax sp. SDU_ACID1]|uniref:IPTL-CTERM sorting domain-containing protein n=1 Tax=Acidovorax sp. SDU_ACID1 TaxID=3136632 RepID=UPI0038731354